MSLKKCVLLHGACNHPCKKIDGENLQQGHAEGTVPPPPLAALKAAGNLDDVAWPIFHSEAQRLMPGHIIGKWPFTGKIQLCREMRLDELRHGAVAPDPHVSKVIAVAPDDSMVPAERRQRVGNYLRNRGTHERTASHWDKAKPTGNDDKRIAFEKIAPRGKTIQRKWTGEHGNGEKDRHEKRRPI